MLSKVASKLDLEHHARQQRALELLNIMSDYHSCSLQNEQMIYGANNGRFMHSTSEGTPFPV